MTRTAQHVAFVSFVGLRVREQALLAIGITLPGLTDRQAAVAQLPALGLLTGCGHDAKRMDLLLPWVMDEFLGRHAPERR